MTYKCLLYDVEDGIATLTLNRPERLNALGDTLRDDLHDAVMRAAEDPDVRVLILTGAGKGFCAGGDVKAMNENKERGASRPLMDKVAPGRDRTVLLTFIAGITTDPMGENSNGLRASLAPASGLQLKAQPAHIEHSTGNLSSSLPRR